MVNQNRVGNGDHMYQISEKQSGVDKIKLLEVSKNQGTRSRNSQKTIVIFNDL